MSKVKSKEKKKITGGRFVNWGYVYDNNIGGYKWEKIKEKDWIETDESSGYTEFIVGSHIIVLKENGSNCGVYDISNFSNLPKTKSSLATFLKKLKSKLEHEESYGNLMLNYRNILMGTINEIQYDNMSELLSSVGFNIGMPFVNTNSGNTCYVVTFDLESLD